LTYDLVAIGNPVYDIIQTPRMLTQGRILSGCSTNAVLAARKLGMERVGLIGSVGDDFESKLRADLSSRRITGVALKNSAQTGGFKLVYDSKGNRTLDVLGIAGQILPDDIPPEFLNSRYILLGPILQEIDFKLITFISDNTDAKIFLDPQGMLRAVDTNGRIVHTCDSELMKKVLSLVDFVKPNEVEFQVLTGETDPYRASRTLVEWGARIGIVTLAERGSVVYDGDEWLTIQAYPTVASDPTGAGDTYAGSFIFEHDRTDSLADSASFASAAASIKVENTGPDFSLNMDDVRKRTSHIRPMVQVRR